MRRTCPILMLVALFLGGGTALAGHALNDPVATTNPGDFWVSGNMDCDGTSVWDGVATFNADAIFTLDVSVGGDFSVTDSTYIGGNLTVTDTLKVGGVLKGGRVWLAFTYPGGNLASNDYLHFGDMDMSAVHAAVLPTGGWVKRAVVRFSVDTATAGYGLLACDINGVRAFADSFDYSEGTGWYTHTLNFAPDDITLTAEDRITVEWQETGILQIDMPQMILDMQLDD